MELIGNKIEFDLEELTPLLIGDKQEGFRQIGEKLLNAVLEKEFETFIGAGKHERSDDRQDYRNGYKERQLKTTLGELNLLRPYARSGRFETKLFENYSRIDKALVSMIVESYLKGVSTRKVESIVGELGIELSHTTVSNLSHELDELVTAFRTSPLRAYYPYLYADATYLKVFNGTRFVSLSVIIAIGVNEEGYREILDIMLEDMEQSEIVEDVVPDSPAEPLSKPGDLWLCGRHRVLCGDATKEEDVARLMNGKKADLVMSDPPYGINIVKVGGEGATKFGKVGVEKWVPANYYPPIKGDDQSFNPDFLFQYSQKIILFGANFFADKLPISSGWLVWDKKPEGAARNSFADCELIWTNFDIPARIYRCTWQGLLKEGEEGVKRQHPTQKPIKLCAEILSDFSKGNDIIADFFLGSGTTLIAAEQAGRICYGCEIDPHYIDVILGRYAKFTGDDPIREDGIKWSELKKNFVTSS